MEKIDIQTDEDLDKYAELFSNWGKWGQFSPGDPLDFEYQYIRVEIPKYYQKSLEIFKKLENPKGLAVCYMRLSMHSAWFLKDFTQAQQYIQQSLDIWEKLEIKSFNYAIALHNQGWFHRELGKLDDAM